MHSIQNYIEERMICKDEENNAVAGRCLKSKRRTVNIMDLIKLRPQQIATRGEECQCELEPTSTSYFSFFYFFELRRIVQKQFSLTTNIK